MTSCIEQQFSNIESNLDMYESHIIENDNGNNSKNYELTNLKLFSKQLKKAIDNFEGSKENIPENKMQKMQKTIVRIETNLKKIDNTISQLEPITNLVKTLEKNIKNLNKEETEPPKSQELKSLASSHYESLKKTVEKLELPFSDTRMMIPLGEILQYATSMIEELNIRAAVSEMNEKHQIAMKAKQDLDPSFTLDPDHLFEGVFDPWSLFSDGQQEILSEYLEISSIGKLFHNIIEGDLPQKNSSTIKMEKIFSNLCSDYSGNQILTNPDGSLTMISADNTQVSLTSEEFQAVEWDRLVVTNQQKQQYETFTSQAGKSVWKPDLKNGASCTPQTFEANEATLGLTDYGKLLDFPEKIAINIYTTEAYKFMNSTLRGSFDMAKQQHNSNPSTPQSSAIKEAIMHIGMVTSALAKLPDYSKEQRADGTQPEYVWRADGDAFPDTALKQVKEAIGHQGGEVVNMWAGGLVSSAYDQPAEYFASPGRIKAACLIVNMNAKLVTPWSTYGVDEREVLLPPTKVQILANGQIKDPSGRTFETFIAKPVRNFDRLERDDRAQAFSSVLAKTGQAWKKFKS